MSEKAERKELKGERPYLTEDEDGFVDELAFGGFVVMESSVPYQTEEKRPMTPSELVARLREGFAISELDDLKDTLVVSMSRLADLLGISKATLQRRKVGGLLTPDESDRVVRFARLFGLAVDVFGSGEYARMWLKSPQVALGGEVPLEFARSEVGAREVEYLLGRIDHGVIA